MSVSAAIAVIVLLDAALIGLLVFVMSRASRLTPHSPSALQAPHTSSIAVPPATQIPRTHPARSGRRIGSAVPARS